MDAERECRICGDSSDAESKLFSPCRCRGTMKYIHVHCLMTWRATSANRHSKYRCDQCLYEYRLSRIWYAGLLAHPLTVSAVSLLSILISVSLVAYFIKYALLLLFGLKYGGNALALTRQLVWWSVMTIGFISMLVLIFSSNNRNEVPIGDIFFRPGPSLFDGAVFEFLGYTFSLTGFGVFVAGVYGSVRERCNALLARSSQVILEVASD